MSYPNKKNNTIQFIAYCIFILFLLSCKKHQDTRKECEYLPSTVNPAELIIEYLEKHGDPANCKLTCTLSAEDVFNQLDNNQYILDLRTKREFEAGHIKGAVHMPQNKICYHLREKINPNKFNRVILICNTGQASTYVTALLRMLGNSNIYAMRWGMAAWNKKYSSIWQENHIPEKQIQMTKKEFLLTKTYNLPKIKTNKLWRKEILIEQVRLQMAKGFNSYNIKSSEIDFSAKNQVLIAYTTLEHYNQGHPEGAIHFEVKESLKRSEKLLKIPPDFNIIVYSDNGFESAYAVAYLNLLGYNAKTVCFGLNGFINNSKYGFSINQVNDFNVVDIHNNLVFKEEIKIKKSNNTATTPKKVVEPVKKTIENGYDEGC